MDDVGNHPDVRTDVNEPQSLEARWAARTRELAAAGKVLRKTERDRCADHRDDFATGPDQLLLTWAQE